MSALSLFLALLLGFSAAHKVIACDSLAGSAARLARMPAAMGQGLLMVAAIVEILAAVSLLIAPLHLAGALVAAGLWSVYALTLALRFGEVLDCGCDLVRREKPVSLFTIIRPTLLAGMAVTVAIAPVHPFTLDTPFAALALLALYFAASELAALPTRRSTAA